MKTMGTQHEGLGMCMTGLVAVLTKGAVHSR